MNEDFWLRNPLTHDVRTTYNLDGDLQEYILPAEHITTFKNETIFTHMRNYLVTEILNERNITWHSDANREKVRNEVTKSL